MSNSEQKDDAGKVGAPRGEKARALAALQGMARPQPKATPPLAGSSPPETGPGSGASGFVGMLAKGSFGSGDSHAPAVFTPLEEQGVRPRPRYPLPMAREISSASASALSPHAPAETSSADALEEAARAAQTRHKPPAGSTLVPYQLIWMLAAALLLIGLWAAGALIYMLVVSPIAPDDVHYPLIRWSLEVGNMGGYTPQSRLMAWSMLACLPVAVGFAIIGAAFRTRARRRD